MAFKNCSRGFYAIGFRTRVEAPNDDYSALNSVELICNDNSRTRISSYEGLWGTWSYDIYCPTGKRLIGFRYSMDPYNGPYMFDGDDTGIDSFRMYCEDSNTELIPSNEENIGTWKSAINCPSNYFICGISSLFQPRQGYNDDIALYNLRFVCCI